ncbi:MAG: Coenzyme F420 hydrogenase/dehydrogenase, beta subunit C-terminal domain [Candidatus Hydrothermarchaeota archaeon]
MDKGEIIFDDLHRQVIFPKTCCCCGTCVSACPTGSIRQNYQGFPYHVGTCIECGACFYVCPRSTFPVEEIEELTFGKKREDDLLGVYETMYSVTSIDDEIRKRMQDGGGVTSLLKGAFESELIDGAIVTGTSSRHPWLAVPMIASSYEEALSGAGTKYTLSPVNSLLREAVERRFERLAFVGTPCQIRGIRKMQYNSQYAGRMADVVKYSIGLFCMDNFYDDLIKLLVERFYGIDLKNVVKCNIKGKNFIVTCNEENIKIPLTRVNHYLREGCKVCDDFTAEFADISVGSVGSDDGYSTLIIRNENGREIFNAGKKYLKVEEIHNPELIRKLSERKRKH